MYRLADKIQTSFLDFNQPMGMHMNPDNRWIQMADIILWYKFEVKYAGLFPSDTGNVAKLLRMALGSRIIQNRFQYPDRELAEQLAENLYPQYYIGLLEYQDTLPFDASTLALFCKRITADCCARQVNIFLFIRMTVSPNHRLQEMVQMKTVC